ncbi:MAG: transposase [candidate division Zixibacteria bacterium]|nr:transposase [candidate division Zixibacteria bacterium]MBU1470176.1 transposase [candidate division Zixibacteria bacterium]MBU2625937.1 transposase [candidate division Zixibacteria bacterium]
MTNIRRYFKEGQLYFTTHVTYERLPILVDYAGDLLRAFEYANGTLPHEMLAWVILPDHFHAIIDPKGSSLSAIIKLAKLKFSGSYRSAKHLKSGRVWQYRFWDHVIRSESDLSAHIDYIHYNPVKHGITRKPADHKFSTVHKFLELGNYSKDWGVHDDPTHGANIGE